MTTDNIMTCRFDGDLKDERARELEDFKKDPDKKVLLCSIGSGGTGLNIVEANHVAFVDPWFNPQTHAQAECRVHRIGQTKPVTVTYFIMDKTIDAWMFGSELHLVVPFCPPPPKKNGPVASVLAEHRAAPHPAPTPAAVHSPV